MKTGDVVEGRYRIIKTLGEGGMGTVFLAEHALIKRRVAIKILHPELATDANVIERFMNEARAAGTLGHPNIVESTDMGFTHNHVPYIVFEYLEGTLLTDEVYRVGGLPVRRAVRIAQQIASALHAAHNADIVHRDLKSDNVFLTDKDDALDHVKVLDFGISRFLDSDDEQTRRGMVMGTPEFMAPEQITSPNLVDRRADIYALGVIMYEMLTARRPFSNDEDPRALLHRIVHNDPPPLQRTDVPHALVELILNRLLAKSPDDRYQSMLDVESALDAFTTHGDAPRPRRSRRMSVPGADAARYSDTIPRPARVAETPWPPSRAASEPSISQLADKLEPVTLPPPPAQKGKPWLLYGLATTGILVGAGGLVIGVRGAGDDSVASAAQPAITQPAPAASIPQPPRETRPSKIDVTLESATPNARVTFRRRVSAAPTAMQITPSDIVELVEVSAPGHKTVRYWLTFDRPTHLTAKLTKGQGIVEASEEETLIALGEIAATPAVAAAAPKQDSAQKPAAATPTTTTPNKQVAQTTPGTAKTVAKDEAKAPAKTATPTPTTTTTTGTPPTTTTTTVAQTSSNGLQAIQILPRRIGRLAAAEEGSAATTEQRTETAKLETGATPPPETAVAKPDVEPAKTDGEPAKVEPKLEAPKPAIDQATLMSVVGANRPTVLKCFADGKKANPKLKGTLTLQLAVDPSGKVKRVQVQSTISGAPLVAACVVKSANAWKFPARSGTQMANVSYPFVIN
ncbi:MAG TPA: protein kinase [Kofleriaceae bacterium]|nr:protein kinase [Kofleriaceae bacterium]